MPGCCRWRKFRPMPPPCRSCTRCKIAVLASCHLPRLVFAFQLSASCAARLGAQQEWGRAQRSAAQASASDGVESLSTGSESARLRSDDACSWMHASAMLCIFWLSMVIFFSRTRLRFFLSSRSLLCFPSFSLLCSVSLLLASLLIAVFFFPSSSSPSNSLFLSSSSSSSLSPSVQHQLDGTFSFGFLFEVFPQFARLLLCSSLPPILTTLFVSCFFFTFLFCWVLDSDSSSLHSLLSFLLHFFFVFLTCYASVCVISLFFLLSLFLFFFDSALRGPAELEWRHSLSPLFFSLSRSTSSSPFCLLLAGNATSPLLELYACWIDRTDRKSVV